MATRFQYIALDAYPLGNSAVTLARPGAKPTSAEHCRRWLDDCESAGITLLVPAVAYYEEVRDLYQRQAMSKIARFQEFCFEPTRFVPLTRNHLTAAARLWGDLRRSGQPTSDPHALDADAIFAAQVLSLGLPAGEFVVATRNPAHLTRFGLPTANWEDIG